MEINETTGGYWLAEDTECFAFVKISKELVFVDGDLTLDELKKIVAKMEDLQNEPT